eukprot:TRINITY_DN25118_c0_g1_i1.p1 TRINITY_DN25118_c0_g1~~TRINITY_DN25118_c0_g1_i1.p1  ORF type:complete len:243 (+),score=48.77 TRINITY_DN25118_c0_g1_i1:50-730(+)
MPKGAKGPLLSNKGKKNKGKNPNATKQQDAKKADELKALIMARQVQHQRTSANTVEPLLPAAAVEGLAPAPAATNAQSLNTMSRPIEDESRLDRTKSNDVPLGPPPGIFDVPVAKTDHEFETTKAPSSTSSNYGFAGYDSGSICIEMPPLGCFADILKKHGAPVRKQPLVVDGEIEEFDAELLRLDAYLRMNVDPSKLSPELPLECYSDDRVMILEQWLHIATTSS